MRNLRRIRRTGRLPGSARLDPPQRRRGGGGGGKVFPDRKVVVTQPVKGEFKAFSAVCTHQGCVVKDVSGGAINCPCHGSKFRIADGSVQGGPAQGPLPEEQVSVRGGSLHLG
ncbi:Rieske (2Fe-2S) protein [Streptomyces rectiverticillatus]|nr:Rieske (2Fe-2S) protein [Streptomyces rectiverticillatus]